MQNETSKNSRTVSVSCNGLVGINVSIYILPSGATLVFLVATGAAAYSIFDSFRWAEWQSTKISLIVPASPATTSALVSESMLMSNNARILLMIFQLNNLLAGVLSVLKVSNSVVGTLAPSLSDFSFASDFRIW